MMNLPKAVENAVCFAQWCVNNGFTDNIRKVGELRVLVNRRADTWVKQNNQEMDWDRAEKRIDKIDEQIATLAKELGITKMDWPGLYPTFTVPAGFNNVMLPEL